MNITRESLKQLTLDELMNIKATLDAEVQSRIEGYVERLGMKVIKRKRTTRKKDASNGLQ